MTLVGKCNDARGTSNYINNCQEAIDYLYANREVLDRGDNWASNTITSLEGKIAKKTSATSVTGTGSSGVSGTWTGNFEMYLKDGSQKKYTGTIRMTLKQSGNGITGSYRANEGKVTSITGTINSNKINFDDGFMFFSGSVATNVLNLNAESCLTQDPSIPEGYCVDAGSVGQKDSGYEVNPTYQYSVGSKSIMTLTRQ